jgi:hypothetical protein
MMRTKFKYICVSLLLLAGCDAPKVSWEKAQDYFDAHRTEKMNAMYYMGSSQDDHYLFHAFLTMHKTVYRVDKTELRIPNEFSVTADKTKWRLLEMPLRIDLSRVTIITNRSEQSAYGYRRKAAPKPER